MNPALGVCYYPEHWPEDIWAEDAARMAETGLTWVRIGEFAWSRMEPQPGRYEFDWLDRAIETLGNAGLKVVLGTPTATPPRWMVDKLPDMLQVDAEGRTRGFGSRRHYCFSHEGYRAECKRIAAELSKRYGKNPHVQAWQIDNEYACHDTTLSYSDAALKEFRVWLQQKYQSAGALNRAWGNVFWSMEYDDFDQIELPNLTTTEPNPAHTLDFKRFSSDQVIAFNKVQADAIRAHSDKPLIHNFMGREMSFDHYKMGEDLDIASWDSYPIGFLSERLEASEEDKQTYLRQGDPDNQAFHHDLYRRAGNGRWWIMEQQPGPVNWAPWNPAPLPGMARLWAWEAFAHGAEAVCYFRWRQAPFAQEQHHAGLLRPDSEAAPALAEAAKVAEELKAFGPIEAAKCEVALIVDYEADWVIGTQPQGADFSYFRLVLDCYRALRRAGLSIDIVSPTDDIGGYKMVLAPGLAIMSDELKSQLAEIPSALIGPRSGAKDANGSIPVPLPPALPGLDVRVALAESLPPGVRMNLENGFGFLHWAEHLEGDADVVMRNDNGVPVIMGNGSMTYLGGWPEKTTWDHLIKTMATKSNVTILELPDGVRVRDVSGNRFIFNYLPTSVTWQGHQIEPADFMVTDI
ncbi:MAG: beta-galactosidase [Boseongicola sp.]|nr:beta-galactosidase [Boseongicola sp.]